MVLEYLPTFARTKSPSFVGKYTSTMVRIWAFLCFCIKDLYIMEGPWNEGVTSPMSLVNFDSESTRQKTSTTGGNSSRNNINNGWISDRFRQMSTKSSVNVDVALFWLHCYFWSICRHRSSGYGTRCVSQGRRLELLAPTASLLRTVWTVSSCNCCPGETQRRDTTGDTTGKWRKMRKSWIATTKSRWDRNCGGFDDLKTWEI